MEFNNFMGCWVDVVWSVRKPLCMKMCPSQKRFHAMSSKQTIFKNIKRKIHTNLLELSTFTFSTYLCSIFFTCSYNCHEPNKFISESNRLSVLEYITLHENIIFSEQQCCNLGQFPHWRTMGVRNDRTKFIKCIIQVVHSSTFPRVNIQSNTFSLTGALGFWWTVQSGSCRSKKLTNNVKMAVKKLFSWRIWGAIPK